MTVTTSVMDAHHAAQSFPLFSHLPAELRLKIWRLGLPRRVVPIRLKLDMDAWNWANDDDWWKQYNLQAVKPRVPLPQMRLACRESLHEVTPLYTDFSISERIWKRCLSISDDHDASGSAAPRKESAIHQHRPRDLPRLNPSTDVLHWPYYKPGFHEESLPLFVAACLSARHVSVEIEGHSLHETFETLTMAVLDPAGPLETLTLRTRCLLRSSSDSRNFITGNFHEYLAANQVVSSLELRLTRVASNGARPLKFGRDEERHAILEGGSCMLPWFQGGWPAWRFWREIKPRRKYWTDEATPPGPIIPCVDTAEYAVYAVLQPHEFRDMLEAFYGENQIRFCRDGRSTTLSQPPKRRDRWGHETPLSFGPWISSNGYPADGWLPELPNFHGFCLPEYGFPG